MKILHLTIAAAAVAFSMAASAESMAPAPTPKGTHLGNVIVNPYGYSPLTAVINRNTKHPTDIKVTVKGKPNGGIDISSWGADVVAKHPADVVKSAQALCG